MSQGFSFMTMNILIDVCLFIQLIFSIDKALTLWNGTHKTLTPINSLWVNPLRKISCYDFLQSYNGVFTIGNFLHILLWFSFGYIQFIIYLGNLSLRLTSFFYHDGFLGLLGFLDFTFISWINYRFRPSVITSLRYFYGVSSCHQHSITNLETKV